MQRFRFVFRHSVSRHPSRCLARAMVERPKAIEFKYIANRLKYILRIGHRPPIRRQGRDVQILASDVGRDGATHGGGSPARAVDGAPVARRRPWAGGQSMRNRLCALRKQVCVQAPYSDAALEGLDRLSQLEHFCK